MRIWGRNPELVKRVSNQLIVAVVLKVTEGLEKDMDYIVELSLRDSMKMDDNFILPIPLVALQIMEKLNKQSSFKAV